VADDARSQEWADQIICPLRQQSSINSLHFLLLFCPVGLPTEWKRWILPIRSMLLPRLIHPMGSNASPSLLDPESIPRVVNLSFRSSIVGKKLYVGNLTYNVNESDLEALFTPFGTVQSAQVIVDRDTNRSKGFGFVEMGSDAEAQAAIQGLNGRDHDGRNLTVNEAKPREERGGGGGRGGYGGGGGGRGGGGGGGYGGGGGRRY
jgi:cold-inducible RNA-binding protein